METVMIILGYLLLFALIVIAMLWAERKELRKTLDQVRADRNAAYERNAEAHARHIRDIYRSADRLDEMTGRLRSMNNSYAATGTTEEN